MKKVITYGTFDLFHQGHYNLLKRAKELGDYLIVGVTTDVFDIERGKLNTHDSLMDRIEAVKATGLADKIIIEEYKGQKVDDIQKYEVDVFAIGSDWDGYFDYLKEFCQVVYLPRTEGVSSTMLRSGNSVRIGIAGTGSIAERFAAESAHVNACSLECAFNPDGAEAEEFARRHGIASWTDSFESLMQKVDAVYIASPHYTHYEYVKQALQNGLHVLCEVPFVFRAGQAEELYTIASSGNLVLMCALKTAYCPAFGHIISLLKSGAIGEIVEVNASITTLTDEKSAKMDSRQMGGSMSENACFPLLPIFKLLGTDYRNINFYSKMKNDVDLHTKAVFRYDSAVASFQVGLGVKSEGNMVVSGTKGYLYVPAPWWKTSYFEIRYEDQNQNKKFFYPYEGEGLRYEIKDFVDSIAKGRCSTWKLSREENIAMARVQQAYIDGENVFRLK